MISKPEVYEDDFEGDGRRFYTDGRNVHKYLQELVKAGGIDGMMTVGEMSSTSLENCIGYTGADRHELSMCFNFHHLKVDYKNKLCFLSCFSKQKQGAPTRTHPAKDHRQQQYVQQGVPQRRGLPVFCCLDDEPAPTAIGKLT